MLAPGPTTLPAIQVLRWIRSPFRVMEQCHERFGDTFTLRMPRVPSEIVIFSDPLAVKDVFGMGPDQGHAGKANFILKPLVGKHSLLLLDGAEHLRQRKMILPAFHGERMHAYGRTMLEATHDSIDGWPLGRPFAVHRPMLDVTLSVILRTVFGVGEGPRFTALADALRRMLDATANPLLLFPFMQRDLGPVTPWGQFKRQLGRASEILRSEIRRGREKGTDGRVDVLAMMLDARDEKGEPLSEDEVHDELLTLLVAGHETTATALAWALRWLLPDRALIGRLNDEIASAGGDPMRLAKLPLLDGTVKEALRLQPVIPMVGRVLQEPVKIGGIDLPAGAVAAASIYLVHRRPSLYPEPERFRPERFLDFKPASLREPGSDNPLAGSRGMFKPAAWEWLPFGGGLRRCVGAAFAMYEMKMVLAAMLPRVEMRLATDRVRNVRRAITITPEGGLPVVLTAKRARAAGARAA
jgi:cytochrome P450